MNYWALVAALIFGLAGGRHMADIPFWVMFGAWVVAMLLAIREAKRFDRKQDELHRRVSD